MRPSSGNEATVPRARRKRRTRQETEADLTAAALRLLERNGVLAGLNLRDVAAEAGVNHGQIYEYFGDRKALLRSAIQDAINDEVDEFTKRDHWGGTFTERRVRMLRRVIEHPSARRFDALLALDGDDTYQVFPRLELTKAALEHDKETNDLAPDVDAMVAHVMTSATILGYRTFRDAYSREIGMSGDELDERAIVVFEKMLTGLVSKPGTESDQQ